MSMLLLINYMLDATISQFCLINNITYVYCLCESDFLIYFPVNYTCVLITYKEKYALYTANIGIYFFGNMILLQNIVRWSTTMSLILPTL